MELMVPRRNGWKDALSIGGNKIKETDSKH